jgi:hypothetical protein
MRLFFFRIILTVIIGFFLIIIISKFINLTGGLWIAIISGILCALLYVVSGFFSYYYASKLKQRSFTRIFLLSITGRFILIISIITLVIKHININTEVFIVSFFIWYFVFQIIEIISLNQLLIRKM